MEMNWSILFFGSLPETFLNLVIILLLAGNRERLKINLSNFAGFISALGLMLVTSWFIRPLVPNVAVSFVLHMIIYAVIMLLIYKVNIVKAFFCTSILALLLSTMENLYIPYVITYVCGSLDKVYNNSMLFILISIPMRLIQAVAIIMLLKHSVVLEVTKIDRKFHRLFIICLYILTFVEYYMSNIFINYFNNMSLVHQITFSVSLFAIICVFGILVFNFIYSTVKGIVTQGYKQYQELENNAKLAFEEVYIMIKSNNSEKAAKFIEEIVYQNKI